MTITTKAKYDPNLIKAANSEAKTLEANKAGVSMIDVMGARNLLATIEHMHPKESGQKAALTKAVNHLSKAISDAKVDPNVRGLPMHPLNPPIIKIRADDPGQGGPIIKIRADDPTPVPSPEHDKVTAKRSKELSAAFHMMKPDTIKWQDGNLGDKVGEGYARVAIEDHRATDGNAIYAFVPLGAVGRNRVDPNTINSFFLQELHGGRAGKDQFSGPFEMPKGIAAAPKLIEKAEVIGEKVAENNGHRLSRSDAVFLRALKPLPNGHFEAKFDVTMWMDANKVNGHIKVELDANGKVFGKGEFHNVRAHDA